MSPEHAMSTPKPLDGLILLISALAFNTDAPADELIVARSPDGYFEFHIDFPPGQIINDNDIMSDIGEMQRGRPAAEAVAA